MDDFFLREISNRSAWEGHGKFAIELVKKLNPSVTVELGVDYGYSCFCLAYKNKGVVYGVDWFEGDANIGYRNALPDLLKRMNTVREKFNINNIVIIKADFISLANSWNDKIDLLHIDGGHRYEDVSSDYNSWKPHLHENSVVLFHDVEHFPDTVGRFFNEIVGFKFIRSGSEGLGVLCFNMHLFYLLLHLNKSCQ